MLNNKAAQIEVLNGELHQWDTNRQVQVTTKKGYTLQSVSFYRPFLYDAPVTCTPDDNGVVGIPDGMLRRCNDIIVRANLIRSGGRPVAQTETFNVAEAVYDGSGAGGGGGIKTAIFRPKQFDEFMAGDKNAYTTALECANMTRDEVIQTIESGQPVDYIVIRYGDSGSGLIVSRPAEPMIEWYPGKDELHIYNVGYWFTNGAIDYPAE